MPDLPTPMIAPFTDTIGPVTRTDFVRFAGAGGDFNPNHHDEVHARAHGYPSVFAMGLFTASVVSGCLTRRYGHAQLRSFKVRFIAPVWPGDVLTIHGSPSERSQRPRFDSCQLTVTGQNGLLRLTAQAEIGPAPDVAATSAFTERSNGLSKPFKAEDAGTLGERIGDVVRTVILPIEGGKVKEFAVAMRDESALYSDPVAADLAQLPGIPAPPVFTTTASFHVAPELASFPVILGLNRPRVVHGEQSWTYHRMPLVGDVLSGVSRLASVEVKTNTRGEALRLIRIDTAFTDARGLAVVDESMLAIEKL